MRARTGDPAYLQYVVLVVSPRIVLYKFMFIYLFLWVSRPKYNFHDWLSELFICPSGT